MTIYFRQLQPFLRVLLVSFAIIGSYGLLSAFGTNLGLAYVNFHLPFVNRIREAGRHLVLFVIGVSFLTGLGYSLLAQRLAHSRDARRVISLTALVLIFAATTLRELL